MGKNFYLMSGTDKEVMDTTNNDSVFRRARKRFLEGSPDGICCSYCRYHKGENRHDWYGGFISEEDGWSKTKIRFPSWKLASRNRKQWMLKNNVRMIISPARTRSFNRDIEYRYIEFEFGKLKNGTGISYSKK